MKCFNSNLFISQVNKLFTINIWLMMNDSVMDGLIRQKWAVLRGMGNRNEEYTD